MIYFNSYIICRSTRKPAIKPANTGPNLAPIQTGASSMTAILMVQRRGGATPSHPGATNGPWRREHARTLGCGIALASALALAACAHAPAEANARAEYE